MQPVLMIGCGGSGTKALRHVRAAVERRMIEIGWEDPLPDCWKFIGIDTPTLQEAAVEIPPLPVSDYLSIGTRHKTYQALCSALTTSWEGAQSKAVGLASGWLPDPNRANVPLSKGAGQARAIGRSAALDAFPQVVVPPLKKAFQDIQGARAELEKVSQALGHQLAQDRDGSDLDPLVVVMSSMGGGTGAGIALDVVDVLRTIDATGQHPALLLFSNDIFDMEAKDALAANSLAFMSELLASYWSKAGQIESPLELAAVTKNPGAGPHSVFLLSRQQAGGAAFASTAEVYHAAGEVLSTWVVSEVVQEQIINFLVTNWVNNATQNYGGYPFGEHAQRAAISSFGVGRVTVGRDRFGRWAEHKLARSAMEGLHVGHLRFRSHREVNLTDEDWIRHLGSKYAGDVFESSGPQKEKRRSMAEIEEVYASASAASAKESQARSEIMAALPGGMKGPALEAHIKKRASSLRKSLKEDSDAELTKWREDAVADTCRTVSEIAALTSLAVARSAVEQCRSAHIRKLTARLRESSEQANANYGKKVNAGLEAIKANPGLLDPDSDLVKKAVASVANGLAQEWRSHRLEQAANTLQHADSEVFDEITTTLRAIHTGVQRALEDDDVNKWPTADDDSIPQPYQPSAVEFALDSAKAWPSHLARLCGDAQLADVPYGDRPIDPVRYRMIAGHKDELPPLLHIREGSRWSLGLAAPIEGSGGSLEWLDRFRAWAQRPGSTYRRFVSEGLRDFLAQRDPHTGQNRHDHPERLANFKTSLISAREKSKPMMRIAPEVYQEVHDHLPKELFLRQPFPFAAGHPAAAICDEVVGPEQWITSALDQPGVMLTSYLEYPVHPIAIASVTEPIAAALTRYMDADKRAHSFWQWRRTRRLDAFVPLPRALLENIVRGFAIARLCGLISSDMDTAVTVIDPATATRHQFPYPLLVKGNRTDILALLLESLPLCFGMVATAGTGAFAAYQTLHDLGEHSKSGAHEDALRAFIRDGSIGFHDTLDPPKAFAESESERLAEAEKYLNKQIKQFQKCQKANSESVRLRMGRHDKGTPTGELAHIYIAVYEALKHDLYTAAEDDDV